MADYGVSDNAINNGPDMSEEDVLDKMLREAEILAAKMKSSFGASSSFDAASVNSESTGGGMHRLPINTTSSSGLDATFPPPSTQDDSASAHLSISGRDSTGGGVGHTTSLTKHLEGGNELPGTTEDDEIDEVLRQSEALLHKMRSKSSVMSSSGSANEIPLYGEKTPTSVFVLHNGSPDDVSSVGSESLRTTSRLSQNDVNVSTALDNTKIMADALKDFNDSSLHAVREYEKTTKDISGNDNKNDDNNNTNGAAKQAKQHPSTPKTPGGDDDDFDVPVLDYTATAATTPSRSAPATPKRLERMTYDGRPIQQTIPDFTITPSDAKWEKVETAKNGDDDYVVMKDYSSTTPSPGAARVIPKWSNQQSTRRLSSYRGEARRKKRKKKIRIAIILAVSALALVYFYFSSRTSQKKELSDINSNESKKVQSEQPEQPVVPAEQVIETPPQSSSGTNLRSSRNVLVEDDEIVRDKFAKSGQKNIVDEKEEAVEVVEEFEEDEHEVPALNGHGEDDEGPVTEVEATQEEVTILEVEQVEEVEVPIVKVKAVVEVEEEQQDQTYHEEVIMDDTTNDLETHTKSYADSTSQNRRTEPITENIEEPASSSVLVDKDSEHGSATSDHDLDETIDSTDVDSSSAENIDRDDTPGNENIQKQQSVVEDFITVPSETFDNSDDVDAVKEIAETDTVEDEIEELDQGESEVPEMFDQEAKDDSSETSDTNKADMEVEEASRTIVDNDTPLDPLPEADTEPAMETEQYQSEDDATEQATDYGAMDIEIDSQSAEASPARDETTMENSYDVVETDSYEAVGADAYATVDSYEVMETDSYEVVETDSNVGIETDILPAIPEITPRCKNPANRVFDRRCRIEARNRRAAMKKVKDASGSEADKPRKGRRRILPPWNPMAEGNILRRIWKAPKDAIQLLGWQI